MNNNSIKFKKIDPEAKAPTRKHPTDAGMDVYALNEVVIAPGNHEVVKTGITMEFPKDVVIFVWPKSRAPFLVGAGVIDNSYQGEILVKIFNTSTNDLTIEKHQGIAQLVITPVICPIIEEVEDIHQVKSERGDTGGIAGNS